MIAKVRRGCIEIERTHYAIQQPERVTSFFSAYRWDKRVTRNRLRDIAEQFQNWVKDRN
jgi:hypothetical protein